MHRRHGHKYTPPFRNLITSAHYLLSYLIRYSNYDDTTVDYIIVNYEATNMNYVTGNYIAVTVVALETA